VLFWLEFAPDAEDVDVGVVDLVTGETGFIAITLPFCEAVQAR
jgi:hypothetical protein